MDDFDIFFTRLLYEQIRKLCRRQKKSLKIKLYSYKKNLQAVVNYEPNTVEIIIETGLMRFI